MKGDKQMKKVIAAMAVMFLAVVPLGEVWSILFKPIIGGSTDQSFIYPIYVGLILLAGLVVGAAAVLANDIEKLRNEIKNGKEDAENQNKSTE